MFEKGGFTLTTFALVIGSLAIVGSSFTSLHDMQDLAHQEQRLMNTLRNHISSQLENLRLLNKKLERLEKVRQPDLTVEELVGDPLHAYSLVRRLTREWPLIFNLMMYNTDVGLQRELSLLPKEEDFESAVKGLSRLQDVYKLNITQLAQHIGALDCFEMGENMFKEKKYAAATHWFKEALRKSNIEESAVSEDKILPHLFLASFFSGCKQDIAPGNATEVLQNLMSQYPDYTPDKESASLFRQVLSSGCTEKNLSKWDDHYANENRIYSAACRGIGLKSTSELRCFYIHYNNPRLLIAPFKMEEQNIDPPILMFHDVISDEEMKDMKEAFAKNRVKAKILVHTDTDTPPDVSYYRTSEISSVNHSATLDRLTRRVGDITNLDMESSEAHQVASYGIGAALLLHDDAYVGQDLTKSAEGNRIATFIFYMNDVEEGGFTVFPLINVSVKPVKGSAVFWFNIDHRSKPLEAIYHAGCPVLRGSKWLSTKWIHEANQNVEMCCPVDAKFPKPRYYINCVK